jgi:5-methylcytosine-specific restriction endonuclease McrBC regulatory subunit McrC
MLRKVCSVSPTVELTHSAKDRFYEFIVYLFPSFLENAVSQGLFRAYVSREHNDANVRGTINFPRHFRHNIPFSGKIAYRTREYSGDNPVTQLVRHTIEYIAESKELKNILFLDDEMEKSVQLVRGCTESYDRAARGLVVNKNLKPVSHPYYTEYEPLRKLCVRILTHDRVSYGASRHDQVNGILFDGASLWEEYLNVVLKEQMRARKIPLLLEHPNNRTGQGRKYLFETESGGPKAAIFPDFILKAAASGKTAAILDAKYKQLEDAGIFREDYFQLLSYMFRFDCNCGMLLYPYSQKDKLSDSKLYLAGHEKSVSLSVVGLDIPEYDEPDSMKDFSGRMAATERLFADYITSHGLVQPVQGESRRKDDETLR